jgi:hypothetical protein
MREEKVDLWGITGDTRRHSGDKRLHGESYMERRRWNGYEVEGRVRRKWEDQSGERDVPVRRMLTTLSARPT